jgi:hypothetical protein
MNTPARARTRSRITTVALGAVAALLVTLPGSASAAQPLAFHDHFTDSSSDVVCGVAVNIDARVTDNVFLFGDGTAKGTGSSEVTLTNPQNGKAVVASVAGQVVTPPPVIDQRAGTITFLTSFKGLPEKIQTAHGPVLTRDAGIITFADAFDLQTGGPVSSQTIIKGPHPEAASDFTLFCQVVTAALT